MQEIQWAEHDNDRGALPMGWIVERSPTGHAARVMRAGGTVPLFHVVNVPENKGRYHFRSAVDALEALYSLGIEESSGCADLARAAARWIWYRFQGMMPGIYATRPGDAIETLVMCGEKIEEPAKVFDLAVDVLQWGAQKTASPRIRKMVADAIRLNPVEASAMAARQKAAAEQREREAAATARIERMRCTCRSCSRCELMDTHRRYPAQRVAVARALDVLEAIEKSRTAFVKRALPTPDGVYSGERGALITWRRDTRNLHAIFDADNIAIQRWTDGDSEEAVSRPELTGSAGWLGDLLGMVDWVLYGDIKDQSRAWQNHAALVAEARRLVGMRHERVDWPRALGKLAAVLDALDEGKK